MPELCSCMLVKWRMKRRKKTCFFSRSKIEKIQMNSFGISIASLTFSGLSIRTIKFVRIEFSVYFGIFGGHSVCFEGKASYFGLFRPISCISIRFQCISIVLCLEILFISIFHFGFLFPFEFDGFRIFMKFKMISAIKLIEIWPLLAIKLFIASKWCHILQDSTRSTRLKIVFELHLKCCSQSISREHFMGSRELSSIEYRFRS